MWHCPCFSAFIPLGKTEELKGPKDSLYVESLSIISTPSPHLRKDLNQQTHIMQTTSQINNTMVGTSSNPTDIAIRLLANKSFHQCLWLPATTNHSKLRVTFATTTNFSNESKLPIILFIGPMFGNRYFALAFDKIAKETGVRVICVDRPGIGGSTPVPIDQRIGVWLETVPRLLQHLDVTDEGVSLVSHSAGTIYLLNTLYYLREILHKERPYVAMLG